MPTRPLGWLLGEDKIERAAWFSRRSKMHVRSAWQAQEVWRMRGPLHGSGRAASLLAVGPAGFQHQLAHVFLGEVTGRERLGRQPRMGAVAGRRSWPEGDDDVVAFMRRPWEQAEGDDLAM